MCAEIDKCGGEGREKRKTSEISALFSSQFTVDRW